MAIRFEIPGVAGSTEVTVEEGASVVVCGANGSGKTRMAVYIEDSLGLNAHRISAHRALALNPSVPRIDEQSALAGLRSGNESAMSDPLAYRRGHRWKDRAAVSLLNDFDFLVQVLFAEQANTALRTHQRIRAGNFAPADATKFEHLVDIWQRLLPQRQLEVSGDGILVRDSKDNTTYAASELSDGERAVFYLIGQTLVADEESLLVVDEPELHVHRSIMDRLWDELEGARPKNAFVFLTHDLEFAASRSAEKFIVREYRPTPAWTLDRLPEEAGFDEQVTTLILGSRKPMLFVEGTAESLDTAIYRSCYPTWTVTPRGSCEEVIHSVASMRSNATLTRVTCAGIVDADDYQPEDVERLNQLGVAVLPVSEIENLVLLPDVSQAIAEHEGLVADDLERRLAFLRDAVFEAVGSPEAKDAVVARYCRRRIDRLLKRVNLSEGSSVDDIARAYERQTGAINIARIATEATERIDRAIGNGDLPALLACYDNKGLLALAARHLKAQSAGNFRRWLVRVMSNGTVPNLDAAVRDALPTIVPG